MTRPYPDALVREVRELAGQVSSLSARLTRIEALLGVGVGRPASEPAVAEPPGPVEPEGVKVTATATAREPVATPTPPAVSAPRLQIARLQIDWERVVGQNWFAIIGVVALAIGVGFFLKLAFDNQWIGPTGRVVLGVVAGLAMIATGEYTARRAPPWSRAVAGGGVAILYLAIYASFGFYDLIPLVPALVFLGLVVAVGWAIAIRHNSRVVAFLALFGAFLTPVLLGEELGDRLSVGLGYLLIIDAGIVAVASVRGWRWYTLIGMVASYALFVAWFDRVGQDETIAAQLGLSGVFLIFLGASILYNILWRRRPVHFDMTLIMVNAFAFYGLTFGIMWEQYEAWFGLISFLLATLHGLVALAAMIRPGVSRVIPLQLSATAVVFLTVAAPLQFTGEWVSVAWAAEGAVFVGLGVVVGSWQSRLAGLAVLTCAVLRILAVDTGSVDASGFTLVLNSRFLAFAFGIGALYAATWLYGYGLRAGALYTTTASHGWRADAGKALATLEEQHAARALTGVAHLLTLWILSAEVISYFDRQALEAAGEATEAQAFHHMLSTVTVLWAVYGALLMAVARWRGAHLLTLGGLTVIGGATAKLLFIDTFVIGIPEGKHWIILNYYFLSFVVVMAGIATVAWVERSSGNLPGQFAWRNRTILAVTANAVIVWVSTAEVVRLFNHRELVAGASYDAGLHMTLTLMWTVYAALLISAGILSRSRLLRVMGIVLLAAPVAKLFTFDIFLLDRGYRVGAFVILGMVLLAMGLAYQHYSATVKGFFRSDGGSGAAGPLATASPAAAPPPPASHPTSRR